MHYMFWGGNEMGWFRKKNKEIEPLERIEEFGDIYFIGDYLGSGTEGINECVSKFRGVGIVSPYLISIRDLAYLRPNSQQLKEKESYSSIISHSPIYFKESPVIVVRDSPFLKNSFLLDKSFWTSWSSSSGDGQYGPLWFEKVIYDKWNKIAEKDKDKDPEKRRAIALKERDSYFISGDSDEAKFFFGDQVKPYFDKYVNEDFIEILLEKSTFIDSYRDRLLHNMIRFRDPKSYIPEKEERCLLSWGAFGGIHNNSAIIFNRDRESEDGPYIGIKGLEKKLEK